MKNDKEEMDGSVGMFSEKGRNEKKKDFGLMVSREGEEDI